MRKMHRDFGTGGNAPGRRWRALGQRLGSRRRSDGQSPRLPKTIGAGLRAVRQPPTANITCSLPPPLASSSSTPKENNSPSSALPLASCRRQSRPLCHRVWRGLRRRRQGKCLCRGSRLQSRHRVCSRRQAAPLFPCNCARVRWPRSRTVKWRSPRSSNPIWLPSTGQRQGRPRIWRARGLLHPRGTQSLLSLGRLASDPQGHIYYGYTYLPEPLVRQYDRFGYAGLDFEFTGLDAYPEGTCSPQRDRRTGKANRSTRLFPPDPHRVWRGPRQWRCLDGLAQHAAAF